VTAGRRILIACQGDGRRTPRAIRFSRVLTAAGFAVEIASTAPEAPGYRHLSGPRAPQSALGRRLRRYGYFASWLPDIAGARDRLNRWRYGLEDFEALLRKARYDVILVQDLAMLPVAVANRNGARVICDAREFYPEQNADSAGFNRYERPERTRLCARWMPRADRVITVSQGLADEFGRRFGVSADVILSASQRQDLAPGPVDPARVRIVHHGVANRNRGLGNLIALMDLLEPRFTLDLFLVSADAERIAGFQALAAGNPRITMREPVPFDQIVPTLNAYDIGIHYLEPTGFNLLHCMPNKLFEFIQARLAVAIGPSPDMAAVVRGHGCGVVADAFTLKDLADGLNRLSASDIEGMKRNSDAVAADLCAEVEGDKLVALVESVLARDPGR